MFLVTGGAGFIGSHLVDRLVDRGAAVRVLDNFSTGSRRNLERMGERIELIEGDLRDEAAVRRAARGVEVVFHQGALPSVPRSIADPKTTLEVNVLGTLNVLMAARAAGCRRVIFASSSSVYGDAPGLPRKETMQPEPLSPYAVSKLTGEHLCAVYNQLQGLETISLRYFNVFGPRQDPLSPYAAVIPLFLQALRNGERPVIYGDGEQARDFTYVENVVEANLLAAVARDGIGKVFNIASGEKVSVKKTLEQLEALLGKWIEPLHEPTRPGDVCDSWADIDAARKVLGYEPSVSFEEGLARTVVSGSEARIREGETCSRR